MNRDETKKAIAVMQAFVGGAEIECSTDTGRRNNTWVGAATPSWNWHEYEYRVKPKPREFWVHVKEDCWHGTRSSNDPHCDGCIKVREVLEP